MMRKAIVLLSGGLDSATTLFYALSRKFKVSALIFDYGQRHKREIQSAKALARRAKCDFHVLKIRLPWKGSALLDRSIKLPSRSKIGNKDIPATYVPARNMIFLSYAASFAEAIKAEVIFIGANALDYSGYPDCRPEFFKKFQSALARGSKAGVEGRAIKVLTPLVHKTKAQIIKMGLKLKVPYERTWSCYQGGKRPCGVCESCRLRKKGFLAIGKKDPL